MNDDDGDNNLNDDDGDNNLNNDDGDKSFNDDDGASYFIIFLVDIFKTSTTPEPKETFV